MSIDDTLIKFLMENDPTFGTTNLQATYGESGLLPGTEYSPWVAQYYSDTCAIRSQQIILRDYGIDISQERLISLAEKHGWYERGEGTSIQDVGKLMELVGVDCHQSYNNTVFDLVSELSQGHRVIVSVDSGELWAKTFEDALSERIEDWFGVQGADHSLIVAGVEVNPHNSYDVKVVLTDPGTGQLRVEYPLDEFMDAWKDSNCFMVSTEEPAPFQFDPITQHEVPSGFATDYHYNPFVIDNDFMLAESDFDLPDDYTPTYSEINHIDISDFMNSGIADASDMFHDDGMFGLEFDDML